MTRAGAATTFWWGNTIGPSQANYNSSYAYSAGEKGEFRRKTLEVGNSKPNPFGLYDVHGNIWDWTEDCWNDSNSGNPGDGSARMSGDCSQRVLRGGSWINSPNYLRAARRIKYGTSYRDNSIGFRVARTLTP